MNARVRLVPSARPPRGRLLSAAVLASALSGCPLTDDYYVDPNAGGAGTPGVGGTGSAGLGPDTGGSAGSDMATGGSDGAGTGGGGGDVATTGGAGGSGGSEAGTGATGGEAEAGAGGCEPTQELCDGLSNDCDDEIDEGADCPAGCTAKTFEGNSYLLCLLEGGDDTLDYQEASDRCWAADDGLAFQYFLTRIGSAEENSFIKTWLAERAAPAGSIWTGGNDRNREGTWMWGLNSSAVQFFVGDEDGGGSAYMGRFHDFADGQPNGSSGSDEDCAVMSSDTDWQWNDVACTEAGVGFVCEQEP